MGARADSSQRRGDVFLGMSLSLSTSTMWRMMWSCHCIHSPPPTWTMASVSTIRTRSLRLLRRRRSSTIAPDHDEERWRVSCCLRKGTFLPCAFTSLGGLSEQVVKFLNGAAGFLKACETAAALRRFGTMVSRHSCCSSGVGSGLGHCFRLRSGKAMALSLIVLDYSSCLSIRVCPIALL